MGGAKVVRWVEPRAAHLEGLKAAHLEGLMEELKAVHLLRLEVRIAVCLGAECDKLVVKLGRYLVELKAV